MQVPLLVNIKLILLILLFISSCQFKPSALLYFKNPSDEAEEGFFMRILLLFSLKSQFLLSRKFTIWIKSLMPGYSYELTCNFCTEVRQNHLLKVRLNTASMWPCRFPIICMQSWYMKGKQMLVTTGPSYMTSLEKAGSNTTTSQWQNHHGKNWREIHSEARRMPVPTAWCT